MDKILQQLEAAKVARERTMSNCTAECQRLATAALQDCTRTNQEERDHYSLLGIASRLTSLADSVRIAEACAREAAELTRTIKILKGEWTDDII